MTAWAEQEALFERASALAQAALHQVDEAVEEVLLLTPQVGPRVRDGQALIAAAEDAQRRGARLARELAAAEAALPAAATTAPAAALGDTGPWTHHLVSIAGVLNFEVTLDPAFRDPVSAELARGFFAEEASVGLMLSLLEPGATVLDLGAHVGGFSLAASAAGARVIAVEAAPHNAAALRISARRNGFRRLLVIQAAVSDAPGEVVFLPRGPFGQIVDDATDETVAVPAVTASELVAEVGWLPLAFIKIDVEGFELPAFRGMRDVLASPDAPPVLYESNGYLLAPQGLRPQDLVGYLAGFGYTSYRMDGGRLIPVGPGEIQPEAVIDYLAVKRVPPALLERGWRVVERTNLDELAARVVTESRHALPQHRGYILDTLRDADPELLAHPAVVGALGALTAEFPDRA